MRIEYAGHALLKLSFSTHDYQYGWLLSAAFLNAGSIGSSSGGNEFWMVMPTLSLLCLWVSASATLLWLSWNLRASTTAQRPKALHQQHQQQVKTVGADIQLSERYQRYYGPDSDDDDDENESADDGGGNGTCNGKGYETGALSMRSEWNRPSEASGLSGTNRTWTSALKVFSLFVLNLVIVLSFNGVFVYVQLTQGAVFRWLSVFVLTLFKLFWNAIVVPMCHQTSSVLLIVLVLFNTIVAPCLVIMATDPHCLLELFSAPKELVSDYSSPTCDEYDVFADGRMTCVRYVEVASDPVSFPPPFIYSFECSSSLLTQYAPVFILQFAITGVLFPLVYFIRRRFFSGVTASSASLLTSSSSLSSSSTGNWLSRIRFVPDLLWRSPTQLIAYWQRHDAGGRADSRVTKTLLFSSTRVTCTVVTALGTALTFGITFPTLQIAIGIAMVMYMTTWQIALREYAQFAMCQHDDDSDAAKELRDRLRRSIERASRGGSGDVLWRLDVVDGGSDTLLLLLVCSLFYVLFFMDVSSANYAGGTTDSNSTGRAVTGIVLAVIIPLFFCAWHKYAQLHPLSDELKVDDTMSKEPLLS